jgi:hypothetical protein
MKFSTSPKPPAMKPIVAASAVLVATLAIASAARADNFVKESASVNDVTINHNLDWQTITTIDVPSSPHSHECMTVGSVDAVNPAGQDDHEFYPITVSLDEPNPVFNDKYRRVFELRDNSSIGDMSRLPVSTNARFSLSANKAHKIRLLRRKDASPGVRDLKLESHSLTAVCVE